VIRRSKPLKRSPLKRSTVPLKRTAVKPVRSKPRPGRLKGQKLLELRAECYRRDFGVCQECGRPTDWDADQERDNSYHMAHIKAKRIGLDMLENVRTLCGFCHRREHLWGKSMAKPVPPKVLP